MKIELATDMTAVANITVSFKKPSPTRGSMYLFYN